ncbi:MAG: hypothetical protein JWR26_2046, partial [Pedosphaera sp.]|nr:hypothetical protein [Pedosphaera sp.]
GVVIIFWENGAEMLKIFSNLFKH